MKRFAPVPPKPNCVSSRAEPTDRVHYIAPLIGVTLEQIRRVMDALPRTTLVEQDGEYLRYVCRSRLFGFKDDVEFERDGEIVDVRSASRVGHGDLGVNRRRVEAIRAALRG